MDNSTLIELDLPVGTDPFARSTFVDNMENVDKQFVAYAFMGVPYAPCSKGAMVFDESGKPSSQTVSGPNGLTGSMTWSFTSTEITETLSITAPTAWSITHTTNLTTLAESWEVS